MIEKADVCINACILIPYEYECTRMGVCLYAVLAYCTVSLSAYSIIHLSIALCPSVNLPICSRFSLSIHLSSQFPVYPSG